MGSMSTLHLIDVQIKADSVPIVKRVLNTKKGKGIRPILFFVEQLVFDDYGFLNFKVDGDLDSPYVPNDEDGTVPGIYGKWYESEKIAQWLRQHSEKGGRLILHSLDGDGGAWGWEFDGRGRMRYMQLRSIGKWE